MITKEQIELVKLYVLLDTEHETLGDQAKATVALNALIALAESVASDENVVVPREPTEAIIEAARDTTTIEHNFCDADLEDIYAAMIAAAPK